MTEEIFISIPDYPRYRISNLGSVYSITSNKIISPGDINGYKFVVLYNEIGCKNFLVHRLVLLTFVGPCPNNYNGSHVDGDRSNNKLSNLLWESRSSNECRKSLRYSLEDIENMQEMSKQGISQSLIAREYGISQITVSRLLNNKYKRK